MPEKDELVLEPRKQDGQRVVLSDGRFIHTIDESHHLNPMFEAARASGIGELITSEDTVSFLEAIIKGRPGLITTMHCGDEQLREREPIYRMMMMQAVVYQAVHRPGMISAMRMASLHADPADRMFLLEILEELEGLPDGWEASGKTHHERTE